MPKLNSLSIQRAQKPGLYGDGNGLYLQVSTGLTKSWIFRYSFSGKARAMGLGSLNLVSLSDARREALDAKRKLLSGIDPITERNLKRVQLLHEEARMRSFSYCAEEYIAGHSPGWSNPKHVSQWKNTIRTYALPLIGDLFVSKVDTSDILKVLEPIWLTKNETARRLRGRLEKILGWAAVHGFRSSDNPARWSGHLENLLSSSSTVRKRTHFKALPVNEMGNFMKRLREWPGRSARALEFCILTTTRTNETLKAKWSEFDLGEQIWTIPANRMKARKEHRVPLTSRMVEILLEMRSLSLREFVFESPKKRGFHLSNMSLLKLLRDMRVSVTTHGFRSTFVDWASERTTFAREVVEMQLAHTIPNKVEAAYRRGDLYLKRRALLNTWEEFCNSEAFPGTFAQIRSSISEVI